MSQHAVDALQTALPLSTTGYEDMYNGCMPRNKGVKCSITTNKNTYGMGSIFKRPSGGAQQPYVSSFQGTVIAKKNPLVLSSE